jgi:hypothetical protein
VLNVSPALPHAHNSELKLLGVEVSLGSPLFPAAAGRKGTKKVKRERSYLIPPLF